MNVKEHELAISSSQFKSKLTDRDLLLLESICTETYNFRVQECQFDSLTSAIQISLAAQVKHFVSEAHHGLVDKFGLYSAVSYLVQDFLDTSRQMYDESKDLENEDEYLAVMSKNINDSEDLLNRLHDVIYS